MAKKGFVTGAARGIGKCTATAFAEAGADVAIVDLDFEEAQKTAKELAEKTGRKISAIKTDCTVCLHIAIKRKKELPVNSEIVYTVKKIEKIQI